MDRDKLKQIALESINYLIKAHFMPNPYGYLYESDLQSTLFSILRERTNIPELFSNRRVKKTLEIPKGNDYFDLKLIYTEYANKIDLVCLDPEFAISATSTEYMDIHPNSKSESIWDQPLLVGIELKYSMYGKYCSSKSIKDDYEKMEKYKKDRKKYSPNFHFLCLCFIQDAWSLEETEKDIKVQWNVVPAVDDYDRIYYISKNDIYKLKQ